MRREIFVVYAAIIDANGTFNPLSEYPKVFDSKHYQNDIVKTRNRAFADYHSALGTMYPRDDRLEQIVSIIQVSDGSQIAVERVGDMPEVPDPEEE